MVILRLFKLLALGIFARNLSAQAILATAMITAELFVGVQANHQQADNFTAFKGLAPFELVADPDFNAAQRLRVLPLADITKGVMADRVLVTHPPLPLGQF